MHVFRNWLAALAFVPACLGCASGVNTPDLQFVNGLWLSETGFVPRTASIVDGALTFEIAARDDAIDLAGNYVVPPFCEGHNHNIGGGANLEELDATIATYRNDGVFYAMMPGSFERYRDAIAHKLNTPRSIDVAFANNGLTGAGGHPRMLREMLMERFGRYPEFTRETLPDKGYFEADTPEELREKWALIRAEDPDFVKVMLFYSEDYDARKNDPDYYGRRGLDPALLPVLVDLAHEDGLRVAVHVDTDADMATALRAGADIIAHLPSKTTTERLSPETIALAAQTRAALVTTLSIAKRFEARDPDRYAAVLDAQRENLGRLHAAGALLVVGSDNVRDTSRREAAHLKDLGVLTNDVLLDMWTKNCAAMVFPGRKIGRLAEGYEASFLVLEGNPLDDFSYTRRIALGVKDGVLVEPERAAPE